MNILCIEDNQIEQMRLRRSLENLGIISDRLRIVGNADIGFKILESKSFRPHFVLLDLNLPGMSGLEFLKKMKKCPENSSIPVIILSTSNYIEEVKDCYQYGASAYLVKSVDYKTYQNCLEKLLGFWSINEFVAPMS